MMLKNDSNIIKDIDCINWKPILLYLDEKGIDTSPIYELAEIPKENLTKRGQMISMKKTLELMTCVKELLGQADHRIFYFIGKESTRLKAYGVIRYW